MKLIPITRWLPGYDRSDLRFDLVAGITVSALVVPKALGYAGIALVPIQNGLYAAAIGALVYAIFGTSRQISTGPSSALAAVAAAAVVTSDVAAGDESQLVAAVTLTAGVLFLALAVFKMGWVSRFLSKAVITGFLAGAAVEVVVGELPKITGTAATGDNSWQKLADWFDQIADRHTPSMVVGAISVVAIIGLRFAVPKLPGALVLVVGGLLASTAFDLADRGVATVGDVPRGLPAPELPGISTFTDHFPTIVVAAAALLLIGFSQTAADARMFATRHGYRVDIDQESVAQGLANAGSSVFQGIPVSTSLSASSLNDSAGARTPMASIVTATMVVLTLLIFAPLFSELPKPVLAAIIIDAVVFGMIDVAEFRRLRRVARVDFWIAVAAVLGVLTSGVLAGVVIGMVLSLGWLVYVNARPGVHELGRRPGTTTFRALDDFPEYETSPGVAVIRFDGGIYFVTTEVLTERLRDFVEHADPPVHHVVLDLEAVNFVDSQGLAEINRLLDIGDERKIAVSFARTKGPVRSMFDADGIVERAGPDRFHASVDDAVRAAVDAPDTST